MDGPKTNRWALLLSGAGLALAAGGLIAGLLVLQHRGEPAPPPPASQAGLVIESGQPEPQARGAKVLRCFVAGRYVGEFTLADCAKRNGVATNALDLGFDQTGALAAAEQGRAVVTPLPPREALKPEPNLVAAPEPVGSCWRYEAGWRKLPAQLTLSACIQALFAGRCEKPGGALYGRWAQQTLRLVPGRVEISSDNHTFRTLVEQGPGCGVANPIG